jgi:spore maturation protein CgeB
MRLLISGFDQPGHMGSYLGAAAKRLGLDYEMADAESAYTSNRFIRSVYWHFCDKRPARLRAFGREVINTCVATKRDVVLTTGCAPIDRAEIEQLRNRGIKIINYSTDDPWNPSQRADWFLSALPAYDAVFSPRRANLDDFRRNGVPSVNYLPFAYDPDTHRPWPKQSAADASTDVLFVGGCDSDRLPLISALIDANINMALFGGYWDQHPKTRPYCRGIGSQEAIRTVSSEAQVCLCLVRRAKRDGHTMRSFEAAAIGGCILVEDTADHRDMFGPDDDAVRYFSTMGELVQQTKRLLLDSATRRRLAARLQERVNRGKDTYADRLSSMLQLTLDDVKSA